jgi:hypothetical protein
MEPGEGIIPSDSELPPIEAVATPIHDDCTDDRKIVSRPSIGTRSIESGMRESIPHRPSTNQSSKPSIVYRTTIFPLHDCGNLDASHDITEMLIEH